jgi:outer membrane protein, multidrug efflux system
VVKRSLVAPAAVLFAVGCAIGPGYHRPDVGAPAAYRAPSSAADSLDSTYAALAASRDSMAARKRDTAESESAAEVHPTSRPSFQLADTAANLSWFDLFQDTVLKQLVTTAISNNRDVRIAAATVQEYRSDLGAATATLFPAFTATGQSGRQKQDLGNISFPGAGGTTTTFTLPAQNYIEALANVSWELDFWGRLRNVRSEARNNLLAQEDSRRYVVLTLVGNVVTAYLQLRQLDLDLEIARNTLASRQETYRLSQAKYDRGAIAELDLRQFEGDVGDAAASVANYEKLVAQQENQISLLLGQGSGPIPRGRALNDVLSAVDLPVGVPPQLLNRRPDVLQAEALLKSATAGVGAALDARLPKFSVNGYWGFENFSSTNYIPQGTFFTPNNQLYQIYAGVSIPIFDFGALSSNQHAAEARVVEARNTYEKTVLTALHDVNNSLAEVRSDRRETVALQTQVQALRIAYRLSRDKYDAGYAPYLDVLTAQRSLFAAEQSLAATEFQALAGVVSLYQSLGGGWPHAGRVTPDAAPAAH